MTDTLRVYVACLASYNAGTLHGAWLDVEPDGAAELEEGIAAMLAQSPIPGAEEWAIHDVDAPADLGLGEHESTADLVAFAELLSEFETDVVGAALDVWSRSDGPNGLRAWIERYRGAYDSAGEYAEEALADAVDVPTMLAPYIDWAAFERDMELGGDITIVHFGGRLYVFDSHG